MAELLELASPQMLPSFNMFSAKPKSRVRRSRTHFSDADIKLLVESWDTNQYPDFEARKAVAVKLNVAESRVGVWFQNRRTRTRKSKGLGSGKPGPHTSNSINVFEKIAPPDKQSSSKKRRRTSRSSSPDNSSGAYSVHGHAPLQSDDVTHSSEASGEASSGQGSSVTDPPAKKRRLDTNRNSADLASLDTELNGEVRYDTGPLSNAPDSTRDSTVRQVLRIKKVDSSSNDMPLDLSTSNRNGVQPVASISELQSPYPLGFPPPYPLVMPGFDIYKRCLSMPPIANPPPLMGYLASLAHGYSAMMRSIPALPPVFPDFRS